MDTSVLALVGFIALTIGHAKGDCFSRDGVAARDSRYYSGAELISCGRNSDTCCLPGQKCGSNLLCSDGPKLTREYCDNKKWQGCSELGAEVLPYGITLNECGTNLVCYNNTACCTNGDPIYYIDPTTGSVRDAKQASINTAAPTWWNPTSTSSPSATATASTRTQSTLSQASISLTGLSPLNTSISASRPGMTTGARAGIGIGCAVAAIGLAVLVWYLLRRRKMRAPKQSFNEGYTRREQKDTTTGPQSTIYQLHGEEHPRQELDSQPRKIQEMP